MKLSLSELKPGQKGVVIQIKGSGETRRRIMDMGIVRGSKIIMIRRAPLGDPLEFEIRDYNLTLRKREAKSIYVSLEES